MCTDHVNTTPTLSIMVYMMSILFSLFFVDFWLYLHYLPYLEICTDHINNTLTTSQCHPYFLSDFITIFHLKKQNLPYLAIFSVHSGHCIQVPFCSGPFWGLFWCKYKNNKISVAGVKIWLVNSTGMAMESTRMTRIRQEYVGHQ